MALHNFAAYKAGTFSTDISNLEIVDGFFTQEDVPAFIHEYCHYIQDITTISSIFGFSLWLRDVVSLTRTFSDGEGKTISIPLDRDKYGETINKFRKYYNLYCGDPEVVLDIDFSKNKFIKRHMSISEIALDGKIQKLAVNEIEIKNQPKKLFFGLIVLQEMQAYYAQKLTEQKLTGIEFSVYADNLPSYPYKFGDFLFEHNNITIDLETKFILIDLCLDTVQATSVFLDVLDVLKNKTVSYRGKNKIDLISVVKECEKKCSFSTDDALKNILPDLETWAKDKNRKYLSEAIEWYLKQINLVYSIKKGISPTFFSMAFIMDWHNFSLLYKSFPSPAYLKNDVFYRNFDDKSEEIDKEFIKDYEAATTIWSHRVLYDVLCSETIEQLNQKSKCPLYESCNLRNEIDDDYTCKYSPWNIIKNEKKIICQYGMAAHSFGLWQNTLDINLKKQ